jgi:23S rRNA pseudouridine1911/1915/1917 synthase
VTKVYRALASGVPEKDELVIEDPIGPAPHALLGKVYAAGPGGKRALSRVRVIERRKDCSLLDVRIETGRPHQIRIHLAAAGFPLEGDPLYAAGGGFREPGTALPGDGGYLLHAARLRLRHPATGSPFEVSCLPPPELRLRAESSIF